MKDRIVKCAKSGGDVCYVTELAPGMEVYSSLSCGFWTNSLMTRDSDFYKEQVQILPELYRDLAWEDPETKLIWLPQMVNIPNKGMIFANGTNKDEWMWAAVKSVSISEEDKHKYPIPGKKDEYYTNRMDMTTLKSYSELDFIEALEYIDVLS